MIRRLSLYSLFSLFALATLLLLVSTIRGFWVVDAYNWPGRNHVSPGPHGLHLGTHYSLSSWRGRFYLIANYQAQAGRKAYWSSQSAASYRPFFALRLGFSAPTTSVNYLLFQSHALIGQPEISSYADTTGKSDMLLERDIIVPAWVPLTFCAVLILWLVFPMRRRWQKASRRRQGLCLQCGYDLRAHHPNEKCPECGTPATHAASQRIGIRA